MSFVHLHTHSHFSLLDGLGTPEGYVRRAAELEQPAIALTDHGSLSGLYSLWKASQGTGVKPIAGCEFYIAPESRLRKEPVFFGAPDQRDRDISGGGSYGHITVLARHSEGLRNLFRLQAEAYRTGFYRKPRVDLELLSDRRDGLIVLTGCMGGLLSTRLRLGQFKEAEEHLGELKDIFGDSLFVETMFHGIEGEEELNGRLVQVAESLKVPLVVTGDAHYVDSNQAGTHSALLCVQTRSTLDEPKFQFQGSGYHLASADEMARLVGASGIKVDEALSNTCRVAELVESYDDIFAHQLRMPRWGDGSDHEIAHRVDLWLADNNCHSTDYERRAQYELDTITALGYHDYFLCVADILQEARSRGIRIGPARGSAGGSLVAHALGIQDLDPIACGLLFERFLNPERVGLPDIDIDVQEDRRDEFLALVRERYGDDCVIQLGTFGTVGAKAALKDAARVLGHPYKTGEERTGFLPPAKQGFAPSLADYTGPKDEIYDLALGLEGTIRSESVHAAAVILCPDDARDNLPLRLQSGKGHWVSGFDMHEIEAMGYVKTDFLGLKTLKVIDDCVSMLSGPSSGNVPLLPTAPEECNDPATYRLLQRGDTLGVFQLDGQGMRGLLRSVAPESFRDIAAVLALYRPGPMGAGADRSYALRKAGKERIAYPHPELAKALEPILRDTYGLIVYQEQVLEVLAAVGGYTYGSAELIFNAMRKKQPEKMAAARPEFARRMTERGYSTDAVDALWDVLVPFSAYSFNKSHATGYALIAYWTAYLKANHPTEWMTALLSNEADTDKLRDYLNDTVGQGIEVLPPDINKSGVTFTPTEEGIRYGLAAIKGVGEKAVASIISKRPYRSFGDYLMRVPSAGLNSGVVTALAKAGAFDKLVESREGLVETLEKHVERASEARKAKAKGQRGLIKPKFTIPKADKLKQLRCKWEHETLGAEFSVGAVILCPQQPLDYARMLYLRSILDDCPGRQEVRISFGISDYTPGCKIDAATAKRRLEALGVKIYEEL